MPSRITTATGGPGDAAGASSRRRPASGSAVRPGDPRATVVHIPDVEDEPGVRARAGRRAFGARSVSGRTHAAGRQRRRCDHGSAAAPAGPFSATADRAAGDLRRPGGHRHRERAAVQGARGAQPRADRGARAADRHGRDPAGDQPARRPTCSQCSTPSSQQCGTTVRCRVRQPRTASTASSSTWRRRTICRRSARGRPAHVPGAAHPWLTVGRAVARSSPSSHSGRRERAGIQSVAGGRTVGARSALTVPMLREGSQSALSSLVGPRPDRSPPSRSSCCRRSPTRQ